MKMKYLKFDDFEKTNFSYCNLVSPKCTYQSDGRGGKRIAYRLPNRIRCYFSHFDARILRNKAFSLKLLQEFEVIVKNGFFPKGDVSKLPIPVKTASEKTTIQQAIELYYGGLSIDKREKSVKTVADERPALTRLMSFFEKDRGILYVSDITTKDIIAFKTALQYFKSKNTGHVISKTSIRSYRKIVKAFLNCMIENNYLRDCDPSKLSTTFYRRGKVDVQAGSRLICIPNDLFEAIDKCSYVTRNSIPNTKEIFNLLKETALRKSELSTLSPHNLYPSPETFHSLRIFEKPDCPTKYKMGFTLKSERSKREIPLSSRSIDFIKSQMELHSAHTVYGTIGKRNSDYKVVEYPFLFPFRDHRLKLWVRRDDFRKNFHSVITWAINEFGLDLSDEYKIHDFRNSLNLWLQDSGMSVEQASYWLGQTEETNKKHYLAFKDKQEILRKKTVDKAREMFGFGKPNLKVM